jgi:hypothetical protein
MVEQAATDRLLAAAGAVASTYQQRVLTWLVVCFGAEVATAKVERSHRFLEEALELAQASGTTQAEAEQLIAYVYGRPAGDPNEEVGGVMLTLAGLCCALGVFQPVAAEAELERVWQKLPEIRVKQAAAKAGSPLPGYAKVATQLAAKPIDGSSWPNSRCPGVPLNPEASGPHHLLWHDGDERPYWWAADQGAWFAFGHASGTRPAAIAVHAAYRGPSPSPAGVQL